MIAKGENLYLRYIEHKDVDDLLKWENDPEIWTFGDNQKPFTRAEMLDFVDSNHNIFIEKQLRLMICKLSDKSTIGCIDLFDYEANHQRAGVGILIYNKEDRRKGKGSEALSILSDYCASDLQLKQLYCNVQENNDASIKLFRNCGFEKIGLKKSWRKTEDGWENELMMQRILR